MLSALFGTPGVCESCLGGGAGTGGAKGGGDGVGSGGGESLKIN